MTTLQTKYNLKSHLIYLIWQRSSCQGRSTSNSKWRASRPLWHQPCPCPTPRSLMVLITSFSLGVSDNILSCNRQKVLTVCLEADAVCEKIKIYNTLLIKSHLSALQHFSHISVSLNQYINHYLCNNTISVIYS